MNDYLVIKKPFLNYVINKDMKVGDKLPPESELAKQLKIGRLTLREILKVYKEEGFIYAVQGVGNFISGNFQQISDTIDLNLGITEMIISAGYKPGVSLFKKQIKKVKKNITNILNTDKNSDIFILKRVRTADNIPVVYSVDYFTPQHASIFLNYNKKDISLYSFIEKKMNVRISHSTAEIIPLICSRDLAHKLEYGKSKPILLIKQSTFNEKGLPLFYTEEYFRPNMFKITLNRRRL